MSWKPEQVLVHGRECFNWENSREHCTCICYRIDLKARSFCVGFKYPRPTGNFQVWPAGVFTAKVPRKQDEKVKIPLLSINSSFILGFLISEGKANLLGAIKTWPGSWGPKKHSYCSHIETVGRLLVWSDCLYTRDDILLPSIVLLCRWLNFPKPGNMLTKSDDELNDEAAWVGSSASELRSTPDWFNGLMRRGAADQLNCSPSV